MRDKIVAGNWKMNTLRSEAVALVSEVMAGLEDGGGDSPKVVFSPPFTTLTKIAGMVSGASNVYCAAQNCADHESGAYTGETSVAMIADAGAEMVIIGHSERRQYYGDTEENLSTKVSLAIAAGLTPIYCVGESLEQRQNGVVQDVISHQIRGGLFHLTPEEMSGVVVAYEPVWAIGTGETASPEQAQEVHEFIRSVISTKYGETIAGNTSILYGGSVKPGNAVEIFQKKDIDGGLIGGASLKATDFLAIINAI